MSGIKSLCATVGAAKTVTLRTCAAALAANQLWKYDNASQQLTTGDGVRLGGGAASPAQQAFIDLFENSFLQVIVLDCPGNAS